MGSTELLGYKYNNNHCPNLLSSPIFLEGKVLVLATGHPI